ncbi:MAG TPA: hypothetical protein VF791_15275 [Pyrinomonadaceae bacterium]
MKTKTEYRSKVIADAGLTRARVPVPILNMLGARPSDYVAFQVSGAGKVTLRVSRSRKKSKKRR